MAININTKELYRILEITPANQNIMLSGKHGIGKSRIITEFFQSRGFNVVTLFLGQMSDPGDLIGLPRKDDDTDRTVFMPPFWFPVDDTPIVLFLDELNRARPEILQTIMDLTLNRKLAGRSLPAGSRIISAVNEGEEYQLTDLDPALVSRFNIYRFQPTVGEWLLWASRNGIDKRIIDFIEDNPAFLDSDGSRTGESSLLEKTPDRRGWERVSDVLKMSDGTIVIKKIVAGIVGITASNRLFETISFRKRVTAESILSGFDSNVSELRKYKAHELSVINESIYRCMETGKQGNPDVCSANILKYMKWLAGEDRRECMAHFCSLFEGASYPKANLFLMTQANECFKYITEFIKNM